MKTPIAKGVHSVVAVIAAAAIGCAWSQRTQLTESIAKDVRPVSVQTFNDQMPLGYLGHPLGTVVRVTGVCIDEKPRPKAYEGKTLLRIETVNGQKLAEPVVFIFGRAAKDVAEPKLSQRFDYLVHEFGTFDGEVRIPEESGTKEFTGNVIGIAAPGFCYQSGLTIHRSYPVK